MKEALQNLKEEIVKDFENFQNRQANREGWEDQQEYYAERLQEFAENLRFEEGRKYIKVIKKLGRQQVVWGFIVKGEDKIFRPGDILKAAGWAAPARNKPRGNVLDGDFTWVRWTGPEYL